MPDPAKLRDSTQIVLPCAVLAEVREELEAEFAVTVYTDDGETCQIIGSPVIIPNVAEFLTNRGIVVE